MSKKLQQIINTVASETRNLPDTGGILFAVSGGPDSVVLVDICANEIPELKKRMHIAYIHHGLRKNADKEMVFVRNLAKKLSVPFYCKKIKVKKTKNFSLEEEARIKRYKTLVKIAKNSDCRIIFTAHTMDDQVETVLLNLISGAGLKGLSGMKPITEIDNDLLLVRPLLSVMKKQILFYLKEKKIDYMFDESNIDTKFRRNFIRHKIIPLLEKINPGIKKNIYRTSRILSDDFNFIESQAKKFLQKKIVKRNDSIEIPLKSFLKSDVSLQRFFLRSVFMDICGSEYPPDFATVERTRTSIISGKNFFVEKLQIYISIKNGRLIFSQKKYEEKPFIKKVNIKIPGITQIENTGWKISTAYKSFSKNFLKNKDRLVAYINPDRIRKKLILKQPEHENHFIPLGMKETVSFSKYWKTHKKNIKQWLEIPLVIEDNEEIVWVVGGHISQDYAISEKSRVLEISFRKK